MLPWLRQFTHKHAQVTGTDQADGAVLLGAADDQHCGLLLGQRTQWVGLRRGLQRRSTRQGENKKVGQEQIERRC